MKMKSGLNLYNAPTSFEVESNGTLLATADKSLAGRGREPQVKRVEHRPGSAREKRPDPADFVSSICDYPRWKEGGRGTGYDANGNISLRPRDFLLYLSVFFVRACDPPR